MSVVRPDARAVKHRVPLEQNPLERVRLPLRGWYQLKHETQSVSWGNRFGQLRILEVIPGNPGFPPLTEQFLPVYREAMQRNAFERNQEIMEVSLCQLGDQTALRSIRKHRRPRNKLRYSGWLCLPLRAATFNLYTCATGTANPLWLVQQDLRTLEEHTQLLDPERNP